MKTVYEAKEFITISAGEGDLCLHCFPIKAFLEQSLFTYRLLEAAVNITLNGARLCEQEGSFPLAEGDQLLLGEVLLTFFGQELVVEGEPDCYTSTLLKLPERGVAYEGFPLYKRSPRLNKHVPAGEIELKRPPEKPRMGKGSLVQMILPPLMMMAVTAGVSILMKRGIYVLMSAATTLMTMMFTVTRYFNEKKDCVGRIKKREALYEAYLLKKRKELFEARKQEEEALRYNYPGISKTEALVRQYSSRIYERNANDDDFITVSLGGMHSHVNYEIKMDYDELGMEPDELEQEAGDLKESFSYLEDKPVVIDLKRTHLGLVGEKEIIHEQLKLLAAQLTFAQSYHDLQIITMFDSKYNDEFLWMNWYPHLKIQALNVNGSINSEKMRDQVLGSLNQILKERKIKKEESKKEARFLPHFLFVIDEPKLIMDHSIMEYLEKEDDLGFSIIYTTQLRASLPEYMNTVFVLDDSVQGNLLLHEKRVVNQRVTLSHLNGVDLEWMARDLSVLVHEQGVSSQIPESITFFDMYRVKHPEELEARQRWGKNESHKTLAVPLGVRGEDDYVSLNLHEKAHGPHGLVAGTTGSGKSEIVQSYILSLAVNFHPYEVGFLLIDYKGGGMAGLFKNLPHLLGTITNLDGSESQRAMASIKSELARRQRIFSANQVNHINAYNRLFKNGEVEEPIPHLFLISDEFAELKKEQPDFMSELVSTARIGRSLGIHLILATQKPSGVVDDQIWTNSKFKLALKVQNEADSREILKTPDAAGITQPGRAYLQVGNNEIYELFQSAYSGAVYLKDEKQREEDNRVYLVNDLGQGELLNDDLSGSAESSQLKASQLDATVDYLQNVFQEEGAKAVRKPWLPSLPVLLISPEAGEIRPREDEDPADLKLAVGFVDIPEEQVQKEYVVDLKEDGNAAFFASSGFGKTTFLMTAALTLALHNTVKNLNLYILDFGNSGLILLNGLPHTADYIQIDDSEKFDKFIRMMQEELKTRKKLLTKKMAQNFDVYNQMADVPLKAITVVVDNFDVVKELGYDAEEFFTKMSRDGAGVGIYFLISATRSAGVRFATLNNFKIKIAGFLFDDSEAASLVGRSSYKLPEIKGRALVSLENISIMQVYSMVSFTNEVEYNSEIRKLIRVIENQYPGQQALRIPVLPEQFEYDRMEDYRTEDEMFDLALGLDAETVELKGFMMSQTPFVIIGEQGKGKTNTLKIILEQILGSGKVFLSDSGAMSLYAYEGETVYLQSEEDMRSFEEELTEICKTRQSQKRMAMEQHKGLKPQDFYRSIEPCYLLIDDIDDFLEKGEPQRFFGLLKDAAGCGVCIIITVHASKLKGYDELSRWVKSAACGLVLSGQGILNIFPVNSAREYPSLGEGLLFENGAYRKILLPQCDF